MAKESDMNEMLQNDEGDDPRKGDRNGQPFVLLLRVTQANRKPLPIGGFTGRAMSQMLHEITGVVRETVIMNDQETVMELDEEMSLMDVSCKSDESDTSSKISAPPICLYFWDKNQYLAQKGQ